MNLISRLVSDAKTLVIPEIASNNPTGPEVSKTVVAASKVMLQYCLTEAFQKRDSEAIISLIRQGAVPDNEFILHCLGDTGITEEAQLALIDLCPKEDYFHTPLYDSLSCPTAKPALRLIERGARLENIHVERLAECLNHHYSPTFAYLQVYRFFEVYPSMNESVHKSLFSAACRHGLIDLGKLALTYITDVTTSDPSPLKEAFLYGHPELIEAVVNKLPKLPKGSQDLSNMNEKPWLPKVLGALFCEFMPGKQKMRILEDLPLADFHLVWLTILTRFDNNMNMLNIIESLNRDPLPKSVYLKVIRESLIKNGVEDIIPFLENLKAPDSFFAENFEILTHFKSIMPGLNCVWLILHLIKEDRIKVKSQIWNLIHAVPFQICLRYIFKFWKVTEFDESICDSLTRSLASIVLGCFCSDDIRVDTDIASRSKGMANCQSDPQKYLLEIIKTLLKTHKEKFIQIWLSYIAMLDKESAVILYIQLLKNPELASIFFGDPCELKSLEIKSNGRSENTWEQFLKAILISLGKIDFDPKGMGLVLKKKLAQNSVEIDVKSTKWLLQLEKEGWERLKPLGRTEIFRHRESNQYLAIKWQKVDEPEEVLLRECIVTGFFNQYKKPLGLLSDYPEPQGVFEFGGSLPANYFDKFDVPVAARNKSSRRIAYIYEFPSDSYFVYLHDPKISEEKFEQARIKGLSDIFHLAGDGFLMTALADVFHNREKDADREDGGRYMPFPGLLMPGWREGRGAGRMDAWPKSVEYLNMRASGGPVDVGDSEFLTDLNNPHHPMIQSFFKSLFEITQSARPDTALMLMANFLAEYLLVDELTLGRRERNKESENFNKVTQDRLVIGYATAVSSYTSLTATKAAQTFGNCRINWNRYTNQMQLWMKEKLYVMQLDNPNLWSSTMKSLYGIDVNSSEIKKSRNWVNGKGFSNNGVDPDIGPFNGPYLIKEGERSRVIAIVIMLIFKEAKNLASKERLKGHALVQEGRFGEAVVTYKKALSFDPYSVQTNRALSIVLSALGKEEEAEKYRREMAALIFQKAWDRRNKRILTTFNTEIDQ